MDLHYVGRKNEGLLKYIDEPLAESWQLACEEGITAMARYNAGGRNANDSLVQELRERWEPHIPAECPSIAGRKSLASAEPAPGRILPGLTLSSTVGLQPWREG